MRLAVVASHPIQYYSPIFRELARRLDLEVFYVHRPSPQEQADAGFGVAFDWDVDLLSGYASRFLVNVAREPTAARFSGCDTPEIGKRLREGRFDGVLVLGWYLKCFLQAIAAAKRARIPILVRGDSQLAAGSNDARSLVKRLIYPAALRVFDAALYVGGRSRQYYEHYGVPKERLFFSPHCVDTSWFAERANQGARAELRRKYGIGSDERILLFAGKLVAFKRPLDVVEAARRLRAAGRPATVMVAGSGPLEAELRAAAEDRGVRLILLGFQNQTAMPACYVAADCLVLPSNARETWGLVVNEALACGRPIVISDAVGCAPDLAVDGSAGRSFPMGDCERLAAALADLADRPPSSSAIKSLVDAYGIAAACDGIEAALGFVHKKFRDR
jgi:glycosyltransferase involved in cell wall biosynthesis